MSRVIKAKWAVQQLTRHDRPDKVLEDLCKHGVGHPNQSWLEQHDPDGAKMLGVHGCDGCCASK